MNPLMDMIANAGQNSQGSQPTVPSPGQMAPTTRPKNRFIDRVLMRQASSTPDPSQLMQLLTGGTK